MVPTPSSSLSPRSWFTLASVGVPLVTAAKATNVAITSRLLRIGANIGTAKRPWALSRPAAIAANPYSATWGANTRRKNVARSRCSAACRPETRWVNRSITQGATSTVRTVNPASTAMEAVTIAEAERQASSCGLVRSSLTTTGMNTDVSTPPRTSS